MKPEKITVLGESLYRVNPNLLHWREGDRNRRLWYQGEEPYFDLFFEFCGDRLSWFQVTFRGRCLWLDCQTLQLQTGTTNELRTDDISYYSASKLIDRDCQLDVEFIGFTRALLQTRSDDPAFRQALDALDLARDRDSISLE